MNAFAGRGLVRRVLDCATEVHARVGPGLADDVYETYLAIELTEAGIPFERGRVLRPEYDGHPLELEFELDFVVADMLVVEVEAVDTLDAVDEAQLRTYVHFGQFPMGLTLNFNAPNLADGVLRVGAAHDCGIAPIPR